MTVLDTYLAGIRPMLLDPAWAGEAGPIDRMLALLDRYRAALVGSACTDGCLSRGSERAGPRVRDR